MIRPGLAALALLAALGGCADTRLGTPQPTFSGLRAVRAANIQPLAVGRFAPGPDLPAGRNERLVVRAAPLRPPAGSTFSAYLAETLRANLASDNRLDQSAALTLSGILTENAITAGLGDGRGSLAATFMLERQGREIWRKTIRVERQWSSSVLGSVAYMQAEQGYGGLFQTLVERLFADPEFQQAARAAS